MKLHPISPFLLFLLLALPCRAENPGPTKIDSPRDEAALIRLTSGSENMTPTVKNLDDAWVKSLADRGTPKLYTKANSHDFDYIGMPVGGIGAGEMYLSGDGRLWDWDIFGTLVGSGITVEHGGAYKLPHKVNDPRDLTEQVIDQGFVIRTRQGAKTDTRTLDKNGFSDITFSGQYPIGSVEYADPASPVRVHLEAFSPFIPTNVEDSSYPAVILNYTVTNTSAQPVDCTLGGWMENAAAWASRHEAKVQLRNTIFKTPNVTTLDCSVAPLTENVRPPAVYDDFTSGTFDKWTVEGEAFGSRPTKVGEIKHSRPIEGAVGPYVVDSYLNRSEKALGKLTSKSFVIDRPYITFLIGGGCKPKLECINLLIDGAVVRTATGADFDSLAPGFWNVRDLVGKTAQFQIVDASDKGWSVSDWGHILVGELAFADKPYDLAGRPPSLTGTKGEFQVTGVLDHLDNKITLEARAGSLTRQVEVNIPAGWRLAVGSGPGLGWNASGVYDPAQDQLPLDQLLLQDASYAAPVTFPTGETPPWSYYQSTLNYGGAGAPGSLDLAAVTYFKSNDLAYGARWIYSDKDRPIDVKIAQYGFAGMTSLAVWINHNSVYSGELLKESAHQVMKESQLHQGWNRLAFKSTFRAWLWAFSIDLAGKPGDDLADLRFATAPPATQPAR